MIAEFSWKNFSLGTEVQVAGTFIYNGLLAFDEMEHFCQEHEVFECLYQLAIGIERLAKVAVILLEHNTDMDQTAFEKSLITHTTGGLIARIHKRTKLELNPHSHQLISLLDRFYNSMRYARFGIASSYEHTKARDTFINFLSELLQEPIDTRLLYATANDNRIKDRLGRLIKKISSELYEIIKDKARELQIFTEEIVYDSKAYKIFLQQQFTFKNERILQKELLIFLLNNKYKTPWKKLAKTLKPLPFDPAMTTAYVEAMFRITKAGVPLDELESICEDHPLKEDRLEALALLDKNGWGIDENIDDDEDPL
ncbi:hypothetical protein [Chitinophaga sp. CF418]|uniref:hypothetical protein n=1 Tax=Chitinophaga sp. CF418 TaxID=1855287 RepID=UPI000911C4D7|nr:hypothetical protein [Chitinophaga sp. CF418]SHN43710.1 hypothetical protein SAMN05216311_11623 [Chitinophaga sp. CF418]